MTYVAVTPREGVTGNGQPGEGGAVGLHARLRAGPRARRSLTALREFTQRHRGGRVVDQPRKRFDPYAGVLTEEEEAAPTVRGRTLWHDGAASPADQWAYLRAGAWAPGEQHWLVERIAQAYGLIVLALTIVVTVPLWVAQRPSRTALAVTVGVLWWAATTADYGPGMSVGGTP